MSIKPKCTVCSTSLPSRQDVSKTAIKSSCNKDILSKQSLSASKSCMISSRHKGTYVSPICRATSLVEIWGNFRVALYLQRNNTIGWEIDIALVEPW